jgi:hypothetical protein
MTHGVVTPLPRIVGPNDTILGGYHVPAGVSPPRSLSFVQFLIRVSLSDRRRHQLRLRAHERRDIPKPIQVRSRPLAPTRLERIGQVFGPVLDGTASMLGDEVGLVSLCPRMTLFLMNSFALD